MLIINVEAKMIIEVGSGFVSLFHGENDEGEEKYIVREGWPTRYLPGLDEEFDDEAPALKRFREIEEKLKQR